MTSLLGGWTLPPDPVAIGCVGLAFAIACCAPWTTQILKDSSRNSRGATAVLAIGAALLSLGYVHYYLRGGPRIIDATYYYLQAKTFARGMLSLPPSFPTAALRGRFLLYTPGTERLSILFPPGYAAALAVAILAKAPWLLGCATAAGLVVATAGLARRAFQSSSAAIIAATLSLLCAALRYHTADTLSHGWSALLFTVATWAALGDQRRDAAVSGLCTGWLFATRPVTALALVILVLLLLRKKGMGMLITWAMGCLPGIGFWWVYQRVTTGSWWHTTQYAYYAVADGPPGCFRYGFGQGIGCLHEHGDFVSKRLPHGHDLRAALVASAVRLRWHLLDTFNFEPLWLAIPLAWQQARGHRQRQLLFAAPGLLLLAYAPFYFDGNFPGGGARFLSEALPIEQVLAAAWLAQGWPLVPFLVFSLVGFATHAVLEHRQLQGREGGHPMFEARNLARGGVRAGLVFVNTDHGFALGHDPGSTGHELFVAREHHDAHDWLLWKWLGEPPVHYYNFDTRERDTIPRIRTVQQPLVANPLRFEWEAEWPVLAARDAWAAPSYPPCGCVSGQQALSAFPAGPRPMLQLAIPVAESGRYALTFGWVTLVDKESKLQISLEGQSITLPVGAGRFRCFTAAAGVFQLHKGERIVEVRLGQAPIGLDWVELHPAK